MPDTELEAAVSPVGDDEVLPEPPEDHECEGEDE